MTDIKLETDARGVARITLNRPEKRNAFDDALIAELTGTFDALARDAGVRAVVLTGEGKAFSAGADLDWMRRMADFSPDENLNDARALGGMLNRLNIMPKPTIALVNGAAMGGGAGLVACCDMAIAREDAIFAFSEARLGLIPATISPYVVEAIGARAARRLFLTAERFSASEALRIGLVHASVAPDQLESAGESIVSEVLKSGPAAMAASKDLIFQVAKKEIAPAVIEDTAARIAQIRSSAEGKEGVSAFLEKRAPNWAR